MIPIEYFKKENFNIESFFCEESKVYNYESLYCNFDFDPYDMQTKLLAELIFLRDVFDDKIMVAWWNSFDNKEQAKFLADQLNTDIYVETGSLFENKHSVDNFEEFTNVMLDINAKKILNVIFSEKDSSNFILRIVDELSKKFIFEKDFRKKYKQIATNTINIHFQASREEYEKIKENDKILKRSQVISKKLSENEVLEELTVAIYLSFYYYQKKQNPGEILNENFKGEVVKQVTKENIEYFVPKKFEESVAKDPLKYLKNLKEVIISEK